MKLRTRSLMALALAGALTIATATPAQAATQNGQRLCSGTRVPVVYLNTSSGSGTWTNYNSPQQQTPFTFPSGVVSRSAPYQQTYWYVVANTFFASTTSTCV